MAPSAAENGSIASKNSALIEQRYASGNPSLASMDAEVEESPKFDDPYEERQYLKHRLAIAFRIFAQLDLAESIAGHITLRDPVDPTSFWVNPFGKNGQLRRLAMRAVSFSHKMLGRKKPCGRKKKKKKTKLTVRVGMHFSLIRDEDLIRVDRDGKVVEGGKNKRLNYGMLCGMNPIALLS
jgi:hypothetical protein